MGGLQMIYGVFYSNYSDWYPVGYFEDEEDAYKYCEGYMGAGYIVLPMKNLLGEKDLSVISLKYEFKIIFREDGTKSFFHLEIRTARKETNNGILLFPLRKKECKRFCVKL